MVSRHLPMAQRMHAERCQAHGFTMIELLTTLVVLAVLLALAAPSMATFINNSRLRASQGELLSALMLARSEATKRGNFVMVEALSPVAGSEFSGGWRVFEDKNGDGVLNDGEDVFRTYPALSGNQHFSAKSGALAVASVVFNPRGFLKSNARVEFNLCGQTGQNKGYLITLDPVGLADVKEQLTCS